MEYTGDNINALLTFRHDSKKLRRAGVRMHGMKKRSATKNDSFKIKLTDILKEIIR